MARRIAAAGFPLLLWARRPQALVAFQDTAAVAMPSLAELGARADHVGVCVVDDRGALEVVGELLQHMRPGTRIAIHSTIHPDTCRTLAAAAAKRQIALIDAPVSGGGPAATAGTLTVMVGGETAAVHAARPVFESFAGAIVHLGGIGAGQVAKLVNNALMAANMALADAAFSAGAALAIDPVALSELINVSSGRSYGFEVRARLAEVGRFAHGASLLAKDVGLLGSLLDNEPGCRVLREAAEPFLARIASAQTPGD
jgi:3-hydroxyisobutyrate dehydrogenase